MNEHTSLGELLKRAVAINRYLTDERRKVSREIQRRGALLTCCEHVVLLLKAARDLKEISTQDTANDHETHIELVAATALLGIAEIEEVLEQDRRKRRKELTTNLSLN